MASQFGRTLDPTECNGAAANVRFFLSVGFSEADVAAVVEGTKGGLFFTPKRAAATLQALQVRLLLGL